MTDHSLDTLTPALWTSVNGISRYQGNHLAPEPRPKRARRGKRGVCGCGEPAYSETALYCLDCRAAATRASDQRRRYRRRKGRAA